MRIQGFTLIELIMIIIILGILAAYVAPRFGGSQDVEVVAAQTTLLSMLRLQQQRAMQDTASELLYGVDLMPGTVAPVPFGNPLSMTGITVLVNGLEITENRSIRFNAMGCAGSCGSDDIHLEFYSGSHSRCVHINEQGYINSDC